MYFLFTIERYPSVRKLYGQSFLIYPFSKTRTKFTVNFHCSSDNIISLLFVPQHKQNPCYP